MPADPTLKMRPGLPSDVSAMVDIFLEAFSSNPIGQTFFPRDARRTQQFLATNLGNEIQDPAAHFLVVTDASDAPIAFAKWVAPLPSGTSPPPLPPDSAWPANQQLAAVFFKKLDDMHEQIMGPGRPHWFLEMMATRAEAQGCGAGTMMMSWGTDRAQQSGVEAYLDATLEGKPLYEKFGFRDALEPWACFDGTHLHSFMVLRPDREATGLWQAVDK